MLGPDRARLYRFDCVVLEKTDFIMTGRWSGAARLEVAVLAGYCSDYRFFSSAQVFTTEAQEEQKTQFLFSL
jgi:hypothetical protein